MSSFPDRVRGGTENDVVFERRPGLYSVRSPGRVRVPDASRIRKLIGHKPMKSLDRILMDVRDDILARRGEPARS